MASNCSSCYPCGCFSPAPAPAGPTGPTGPAGPAAITAYGGIYSAADITLTLEPGYQAVSLTSPMPSHELAYDLTDPQATAIVISKPGDYEVSLSVGYQGGPVAPYYLQFAVLKNGTAIPLSEVFVTSSDDAMGDSVLTVSNSFIAALAQGDRLELAAGTSDTNIPNVLSGARLMVKRLGGQA